MGKLLLTKPLKLIQFSKSFCNASGQTPNLSKSSIIFSKCVDNQSRSAVKAIFPVPDLEPNAIYLGHPLIFNHNDRTKSYEFSLQIFRAKLTTIKAKKLNHAGRLVYINSVLASIPIYYMSTILFSKITNYYYQKLLVDRGEGGQLHHLFSFQVLEGYLQT